MPIITLVITSSHHITFFLPCNLHSAAPKSTEFLPGRSDGFGFDHITPTKGILDGANAIQARSMAVQTFSKLHERVRDNSTILAAKLARAAWDVSSENARDSQ